MIIWLSWPWNFLGQVACFSPLYVIYHHFLSFFSSTKKKKKNTLILSSAMSLDLKRIAENVRYPIFSCLSSAIRKKIVGQGKILFWSSILQISSIFWILCKELQKKCFQRTERRIGGLNMNEWMSSYYCWARFSECLFL